MIRPPAPPRRDRVFPESEVLRVLGRLPAKGEVVEAWGVEWIVRCIAPSTVQRFYVLREVEA